MALDISLIGLDWLLAACSVVLWLRKYRGQRIGRGHPEKATGTPCWTCSGAGFPLWNVLTRPPRRYWFLTEGLVLLARDRDRRHLSTINTPNY